MRREGKVEPFIPCEVRAHTGPARATTLAVARRCRRATEAVGAWAKAYPLGRRRLCPGNSACTRARMHVTNTPNLRGRQRMRPCDDGCHVGRVFFHKHPKLQRSSDDVCVQATTPASGRRCLDLFFQTLAFFRALAIQTKLFHYLFLKITETVLKMVIQSYFY